MNFKWFDLNQIDDINELKKCFRNLVLHHHPDRGGKESDIKEINNEYEKVFNYFTTMPGFNAKKDGQVDDMFREIIEELSKYDNIDIDITGSWVWVSGKGTFSIKSVLMELGFKYSGAKKMWYYVPEGQKKKIHKGYKGFKEYSTVKAMWGGQTVVHNEKKNEELVGKEG